MSLLNRLLDPPQLVDERENILRSLRGPVRLRTLTTLRWLAVAGQGMAIALVHFALGFPLELGFCLAVIAASAWLNIFAVLRFSRQHFLSDQQATAFIAFDIAQLCALLALTGGLHNPFAVLILAPVTIAASVLPMRHSIFVGVLAIIGITIIAIVHLPLPWGDGGFVEFPNVFTIGVWVALVFAVAFFASYAHRVAAEAGQMKSALAATQMVLAREERLAAIGGLAAAAAHELGTPLATIQLTAKEMAKELKGQGLLEEDAKLLVSQAERCRDILGRLSNQRVENDEMLERVGVGLLAEEAAAPFAAGEEGAPAVIFELMGTPETSSPPILRRRPEVIYGIRNFVENATIFARSKVLVTVAWNEEEISIEILDDGPGFSPEILGRLGEPYVSSRARSRSPMTRKSGLGLGFFIAKTLLERTGAKIGYANRSWPEPETATGAWISVSWRRSDIEVKV